MPYSASSSKSTSSARIVTRPGLGLARLRPQWAEMLRPRHLGADAFAGLTVALAAIPLSLALAIASDAPPAAGLVSAIAAGIVCSLLGGTPLAVSGPANAMAVLVASIIEEHGPVGLALAAFLAGGLQVLTGALGLARIARLVPLPVVLGFTAGIGAVIIVGQLPRALGLPAPDQAHVVDVLVHIGQLFEHANWTVCAFAVLATAIVLVGPRLSAKLPAQLLAVLVVTAIAAVTGIELERVGEIPRSLFHFPALTLTGIDPWSLIGDALVIYALASLESLLSSSALDRMTGGPPHDPDQELVGQGLGSIASAALGGIPTTSVIARSTLSVAAGGRTRRAALFHALFVLLFVVVLAPLVSAIPLVALAGILFAVALRMVSPGEFVKLWRLSRREAATYLVTFAAMVAFDLVAGVRVGIGVALVIAALRLGRSDARLISLGQHGPYRVALRGPLTFMAQGTIDELRARTGALDPGRPVLVDLSEVGEIDVTGGDAIAALLRALARRGHTFAMIAPPHVREAIAAHDPDGTLASLVVDGEAEAMRRIARIGDISPVERLAEGVARFRVDAAGRHRDLFARLAEGQRPHTLFIACADSRVSPQLITGTEPGELVVLRNVGNIVPKPGRDEMPAEAAGVEYAVHILGVSQIVVCGHSGCGAMAVVKAGIPDELPNVRRWLVDAEGLHERVPPGASADALARANVMQQLENLRAHPMVRERLAAGTLTLSGWYYDIAAGEIEVWDAERGAFVPLAPPAPATAQRSVSA